MLSLCVKNKSPQDKDMQFLRLFPVYLLLTFLANLSSAAPASTSELSVLTFNPAENSKTMPVENNIDITYGSTIKKGDGVITLKDSAGNTVESYQAGSSSNISIAGSVLSINPTAILASDKTYSINIPVGAVQDTSGNNFEEVIEYEFKTQIDLAFMLMGYNGTTLYETTDSFKAAAELAMTQMGMLSFNRLNSYRTHMLPISNLNGEMAQAKAEIAVIDAALDGWGPDNVFTNYYYEGKTKPGALRNPTAEEISVLKSLRQWLVENEKGAANWKDTDLGKEHYQWINSKVMIFCGPADRAMLDGVRMPAGFDRKEYRVISFILSSDDPYNVGAKASAFGDQGGKHWNILDSEGVQILDGVFFYDDHSPADGNIDRTVEQAYNLRFNFAKTDVHEYIHTQGGDHDNEKWDKDSAGNPSCVSSYSVMSACGPSNIVTYPIYNRIYITGWLPETAITTDPSLVQDSYNATDPSKKYLLKLGNFRYQELFNGTWYQYSVRSFERQMNICYDQNLRPDGTVIGGTWQALGDETTIDSLYTCGQLVVDPACIVTGRSPLPGLNGEVVTGRNFANCEFIDIETELSRELFLKFLGRQDGSVNDYSGSIDRKALRMEVTDDAARLAAVAPLDSDDNGVEDDLDLDASSLDASESLDGDGDGVGDNADAASEYVDSDGDGVDDSAPDLEVGPDALPLDASESVDSDGDGVGDSAPDLEVGSLDNNSSYLGRAYHMTASTSPNLSEVHIINTSDSAQSFTGTLFHKSGSQLGESDIALHDGEVASQGRVILRSSDLERRFNESPWTGPAMLDVQSNNQFELMSRLSRNGRVTNTNCVRTGDVHNVEGTESSDVTYIRFINDGSTALSDIRGTLYDASGDPIGQSDTQFFDELGSREAIFLTGNTIRGKVGESWTGATSLVLSDSYEDLQLMNLNFVNDETFFNFSCFERASEDNGSTSYLGRAYHMTTSTSPNLSEVHIINTSNSALSFTGTLFHKSGSQLGESDIALHEGIIAPQGRLILFNTDLEQRFNEMPWTGPAMLDVRSSDQFELMTRLSRNGRVTNTNCVRTGNVHNVEGTDSSDVTYIRFINDGSTTLSDIRGTLYDASGDPIGQSDTQFFDELGPREAIFLTGNTIRTKIGESWTGIASLVLSETYTNLQLMNLNFVNDETFFNFSCYETGK